MRAGIDVRPALRRKTGVGRYLSGLVPALVAEGIEVVAFSASLRDRLDRDTFPGARIVDRRLPTRLLSAGWNRLGRPSFESLAGAVDVTHSATPLPVPSEHAARVTTIHDLYFLRDAAAAGGEVGRDWIPRLARAVREADAVICVSEATAHEAHRLLGAPIGRLHVVHHGIEPAWFEPVPPDEARARAHEAGGRGRFLLAVGALEVRKNFPRLVSVLARLRSAGERDLGLVIAGPDGADRVLVEAAVRRLGLDRQVTLSGYCDDLTLRSLYASAALVVMPSLDEGFGFPVLEAMAAGCPVVAARAGALPEVGGDAAAYADPLAEESMFAEIAALLASPERLAACRRRGLVRARTFTWEAAARKTALVYRSALLARSARSSGKAA